MLKERHRTRQAHGLFCAFVLHCVFETKVL